MPIYKKHEYYSSSPLGSLPGLCLGSGWVKCIFSTTGYSEILVANMNDETGSCPGFGIEDKSESLGEPRNWFESMDATNFMRAAPYPVHPSWCQNSFILSLSLLLLKKKSPFCQTGEIGDRDYQSPLIRKT